VEWAEEFQQGETMSVFTILIIIALIWALLSLIPKLGLPVAVSVVIVCIALLVRSYGT
jgi:hypothetical protein